MISVIVVIVDTSSKSDVGLADPRITDQPVDATVAIGEDAVLSVTATGTGTLTYQWRKYNVSTPENISGATSSTLTLSATDEDDNGDYDVVVTGDLGSVTSVTVTVTVEAGVTPADYLITNDSEWTTVFANNDATLSGKVIAVRAGSYTVKTLTNRNPASTLRIVAEDAEDQPIIDELIIDDCSNLSFEDLKLVSSAWGDLDATNVCVRFLNTVDSITFARCSVWGNYRGVVGDLIDVVNPLPEYACIAVDITAGAVSGLEITQSYVGDLMADGTYSLDFSAAGGTGATATFDVVSGEIVSTDLTAGGTGYSTSLHRTRRATWTGQHRMLDYLRSGFRTTTPCDISNLVIEDCDFRTLANAIKPTGLNGAVTVEGCTFDRIYMDYIALGVQHPDVPFPMIVRWNFGTNPFSVAQFDAGDPHSDFVQTFADDTGGVGNVTVVDWDDMQIEGNVFVDGTGRGAVQGIFVTNQPLGIAYSGARVAYNFLASKIFINGLSISNPRDAFIYRNTIVRYDPTDTANNTSTVKINIPTVLNIDGNYYAYGHNQVRDNISEGFPSQGWGYPEVNRIGNVTLGLNGATIAYATAFDDPTATRTTLAQIIAAYTALTPYDAKGCFGNTSLVDHVNRTIDRSLEPTFLTFTTLLDATTSSTQTSNWCRAIGGADTLAISITGGEYRSADDDAGTNATSWTSSSGTVSRKKFIQVRHTASASNSTITTSTLTVGANASTFQSITVSAATFNLIDNQSTAWSRIPMSALTGETGLRKVCLVVRCKPDSIVSNQNVMSDSSASSQRLFTAVGSLWRYQAVASTRCQLRPPITANTAEITHFITLDFTNTNPSEGCIWATDVHGVILNNTPGTSGTFDTRTTAGSGSDYGAASFNAVGSGSFLGATAGFLGLFGEGDGGGVLLDGRIAHVWIDWGGSGYALPDVTDPAVRNEWSADLIGANGEGPTGSTPKLFYTGDAAAWNAGFANLGSLTAALAKQAGTYV